MLWERCNNSDAEIMRERVNGIESEGAMRGADTRTHIHRHTHTCTSVFVSSLFRIIQH